MAASKSSLCRQCNKTHAIPSAGRVCPAVERRITADLLDKLKIQNDTEETISRLYHRFVAHRFRPNEFPDQQREALAMAQALPNSEVQKCSEIYKSKLESLVRVLSLNTQQ